MAIRHVNELVLALVEKKGGTKGVSIYGVDELSNEKYTLTLSKKEIKGVHSNLVKITPAMPTDDLQMVVQGKQLADSKYISAQHLRDKYLGVKAPSDETRRIALEEAMQSDEMRTYRIRKAMIDYYGEENALNIIWQSGPAAQQAFMPPIPEGYEWATDENGKVSMRKKAPPPPSPQPPNGGPPMGPTPMGAGGAPPMGPSIGPPQGPPIQPPGIAGPQGGGIPPNLTGQIQGENLGMDQGMDPLLFDALMNQQGSPNEQMNQTIGIQP